MTSNGDNSPEDQKQTHWRLQSDPQRRRIDWTCYAVVQWKETFQRRAKTIVPQELRQWLLEVASGDWIFSHNFSWAFRKAMLIWRFLKMPQTIIRAISFAPNSNEKIIRRATNLVCGCNGWVSSNRLGSTREKQKPAVAIVTKNIMCGRKQRRDEWQWKLLVKS